MTSILASRPPARLSATGDSFAAVLKAADCRILCFGYSNLETHIRTRTTQPRARNSCVVFSGKLDDSVEGDDASDREESGSDSVSRVFSFLMFLLLLSLSILNKCPIIEWSFRES